VAANGARLTPSGSGRRCLGLRVLACRRRGGALVLPGMSRCPAWVLCLSLSKAPLLRSLAGPAARSAPGSFAFCAQRSRAIRTASPCIAALPSLSPSLYVRCSF